ncbi:FeoA family protein [Paraferrimonas sp. SM1919]|uniref:FeoA family protein n=1 Tax=Paraferrimonas sp. SM1919 TaxID=2662263 RepID=UPI0013CF55F0|nr:FeoA family protein [Paraferrimonas sp. SM1919]
MNISQMTIGSDAQVLSFNEQISPVNKRKLLAMGVTPNATMTLVRFAPLGHSVEIEIRGSLLCLRNELAQMIEVSQ